MIFYHTRYINYSYSVTEILTNLTFLLWGDFVLTLPANVTCGYFDCSKFRTLEVSPKRTVTKYEIEFYLEDGKTTTIDNRTYEIKKDHVLIAKPDQVRYSELPFRTAYIKFTADGEIARRLEQIPEYFCSSHPQKIYDKIDEIILLNEVGNKLLFYSQLLSLLNLVLLDAGIPPYRNGNNYEIVVKAKRYIETNFEKPIKLKDIAASVHLSEIYFHNIFCETVGRSPHQYLIDCRIKNAKKLLWDTDIPICVVAEKSGFGCQQYFNKVFKMETGMTPASYRKSFLQNYSL